MLKKADSLPAIATGDAPFMLKQKPFGLEAAAKARRQASQRGQMKA